MSEIRYHLDEHMDTAIAIGLRRRGIDVTTTVEAGLLQASDPEHIAFAISEGRVLVTRDRGILAQLANLNPHPGVVVARSGRRSIGPNVLALTYLHRTIPAEDMVDRVEYL